MSIASKVSAFVIAGTAAMTINQAHSEAAIATLLAPEHGPVVGKCESLSNGAGARELVCTPQKNYIDVVPLADNASFDPKSQTVTVTLPSRKTVTVPGLKYSDFAMGRFNR